MSLIMIPGPEGFLEVHYHRAPQRHASTPAPVVMIVPPHPKEGTLSHPVIYTMYHAFISQGFDVIRFNFRGCGKSQGTYVENEGEVMDAAFCWDWLCKNLSPLSPKWVAGFSLGSWVAMQILMRRPECQYFSIVCPPTNFHDFNFLAPCPVPGLIIHGEMDDVVPEEGVAKLANTLSLQRRGHKIAFHVIPKADHFFSEQLDQLEQCLVEHISQQREQGGDALLAKAG